MNVSSPSGDGLPKVVLIGDSIRLGYERAVGSLLEGQATVVGPAANCEDTTRILDDLDDWVLAHDADVVHLNAGLHDLKRSRDDGGHQVPLAAYRRNLERIVRRVQTESDATLIYATTTPVLEARHAGRTDIDFDRRQADVERYNEVAVSVMRDAGVAIDDLHRVVVDGGIDRLMDRDGTHYTAEGYEELASAVAAVISSALTGRTEIP